MIERVEKSLTHASKSPASPSTVTPSQASPTKPGKHAHCPVPELHTPRPLHSSASVVPLSSTHAERPAPSASVDEYGSATVNWVTSPPPTPAVIVSTLRVSYTPSASPRIFTRSPTAIAPRTVAWY